MTWGVVPRAIESPKSTDELFDICRRQALDSGLAHRGERVVVTAGLPIEVHGTTNVLRVLTL